MHLYYYCTLTSKTIQRTVDCVLWLMFSFDLLVGQLHTHTKLCNSIDKRPFTHVNNLKSSVILTCMYLDGVKKPEYLKRKPTQAKVEHATSSQEGMSWDLKPEPQNYEVTLLPRVSSMYSWNILLIIAHSVLHWLRWVQKKAKEKVNANCWHQSFHCSDVKTLHFTAELSRCALNEHQRVHLLWYYINETENLWWE